MFQLSYAKSQLYTSAKSIDSGQPAQSVQIDLSRYFLLCVNFLHVEDGPAMVKCMIRYPGILGSSSFGSSVNFMGLSLDKIFQSPDLILVKLRKDMNNVSCRRDITEVD